jgi:benzodiazapine receptor
MNNRIKLILSILISLAAGAIGSIFTSSAIPTWYAALNKPFFNPPNYLFGPVWTVLYIMMGIALYLVWAKGYKKHKKAINVFGIQLILNALWSVLFFGMRNPLLAFIEIILLWSAILYTIILFHKTSKTAAYLLIPYLLWVSFASVLNFYIFYLN